jgi:hypothetical protein
MIPKPEKCNKLIQNVPNGHKISQISIKYSKWPKNISTLANPKFTQIGIFENKPSGNPDPVNSAARRAVKLARNKGLHVSVRFPTYKGQNGTEMFCQFQELGDHAIKLSKTPPPKKKTLMS